MIKVLLVLLSSLFLFPSGVFAQTENPWPMVAANLERTSWTPEEVRGQLTVDWYKPIEPYIPYKIQPIAAEGKIFVATAKGLYAFDATNGSQLWVYPTELPLGNSPTYVSGVLYVPSYDHTVHAVQASTGSPLPGYTPYQAGAGFDTSPLVINNSIYIGNRDGYFYALNATTGSLLWRYQTGGPITYAAAYKNGVIYFASQDMHAYALNTDGTLHWQSAKLPGTGFFSFWPVMYKNYVVFGGGTNYRISEASLQTEETNTFTALYSGGVLPISNEPGDWVPGTQTMNLSIITNYLADTPHRRRAFFLDTSTGQEYTFTDPATGKTTYAPFSWSGVTTGGDKYPAVVNGVDGVYYQQTAYEYGSWITAGAAVGWKFGTPIVSRVSQGHNNGEYSSDEPVAYSGGGRLLYWTQINDFAGGAFDITIPYGQPNRAWQYWNNGAPSLPPGYQAMYFDGFQTLYNNCCWQVYSGKNQSKNGIYSKHGTAQTPPIPYRGKVYVLKSNALIAFSPTGTNPQTPLPLADVAPALNPPVTPTVNLLSKLESEIQKMLTTGHLKPGYYPGGFYDVYGNGSHTGVGTLGEISDYFQNPADTVYTILLAYPHLSPQLQPSVAAYIKDNYGPGKIYDVTRIAHIGWGTGADRGWSGLPPDWFGFNSSPGQPYKAPLDPKETRICGGGDTCGYWNFPPFNFYAAWKMAQVFGATDPNYSAAALLTRFSQVGFPTHAKPEPPPSGSAYPLNDKSYLVNLYAAGYLGYLNLLQMAGQQDDAQIRGYYNQMLALRTTNFSKDTPYWNTDSNGFNQPGVDYNRELSVARNFMFLTPELADYMHQQIPTQVQTALDEYNYVAPYWFVARFDTAYAESGHTVLYDYSSLFQAKAWILKQSQEELVKYLDVPAFKVGDLLYIQNLVAAIEAPSGTVVDTDLDNDGDTDISDHALLIDSFDKSNCSVNILGDCRITIFDFNYLVSVLAN